MKEQTLFTGWTKNKVGVVGVDVGVRVGVVVIVGVGVAVGQGVV